MQSAYSPHMTEPIELIVGKEYPLRVFHHHHSPDCESAMYFGTKRGHHIFYGVAVRKDGKQQLNRYGVSSSAHIEVPVTVSARQYELSEQERKYILQRLAR